MAKVKISQYDATAGNNTDIDSIDLGEGSMVPSNVNNALRELMAHLKDMDAGTQALTSPQLTSVDINGGTIDGATIGGNSAAAISGTTLALSGNADLNGDLDVDGTTNLDVVDIDGAVDMASTLAIGGIATVNRIINATNSNDPWLKGVNSSGTETSFIQQAGNAFFAGNVGIGTTSPACNFHIKGDNPRLRVEGDDNTVKFDVFMDDSNPVVGTSSNHDLVFMTNDAERMRLDNVGTLFLGTTSPTLHSNITGIVLDNGSLMTEVARGAGKSLTLAQNLVIDSGNTFAYLATDEGSYYQQFGGSHFFATTPSGSAGADATLTNRMVILNNGNIGIGTASPVRQLSIVDDGTRGQAMLELVSANNDLAGIFLGRANNTNVGGMRYFHATNHLALRSNDVDAVIINSSGNVGIGVTPSPWVSSAKVMEAGGASVASLSAADAFFSANAYYDGAWKYKASGVARNHYMNADGFVWRQAASGSANGAISWSEAMRIDSSNNLLVGQSTTTVPGVGNTTAGVSIKGDDGSFFSRSLGSGDTNSVVTLNRSSHDGNILGFNKAGSTVGSISSLSGLFIQIQSAGNTAGVLFGGSEINPVKNQSISDNTIDLGQGSYRFDDIFATNGTIQTSDRNEKQDIAALTSAEMLVAKRISTLFKTFRWKDKVAAKGDDARTHSGIVAQDVQAAFAAESLDAGDYSMFISTTWTNDDGDEQTRMGIRYPELLSFLAGYNEQRFAAIETRLTALEG